MCGEGSATLAVMHAKGTMFCLPSGSRQTDEGMLTAWRALACVTAKGVSAAYNCCRRPWHICFWTLVSSMSYRDHNGKALGFQSSIYCSPAKRRQSSRANQKSISVTDLLHAESPLLFNKGVIVLEPLGVSSLSL